MRIKQSDESFGSGSISPSNLINKRLRSHFHWPLFWVTMALSLIGFINLFSATTNINAKGLPPLFLSQLIWFGIGVVLSLIVILVDYRVLLQLAYPVYALSIGLLLAVVFFGKAVAGNQNWLAIGPFTVQPSEFAKIAFVVALARYLSDHPTLQGYDLKELVRPLLILFPPLLLILLGKDIGSSLFLLLSFGTLIIFSGVKRSVVIACLVIALVGAVGLYKKGMSDHQRARIDTFLHPEQDPRGRGYHLLQSKITVGSGRFFGKGYLNGIHSKLLYLPDKHTDFIFPVLAEEWGFVGSVVVIVLYAALIGIGIQLASKAKERFGVYLALGVTALIFWQIVINLGGVLGLMPLTGVTLPLLSYGGSSLITVMIAIALLMNISMRRFMF
ncbi:MAG: rod shape-determining protein RodA [Deltaproteobacteria bacterium]|nr:rod shape-determining protein RodA [Deltaproteobacteria bacterium]